MEDWGGRSGLADIDIEFEPHPLLRAYLRVAHSMLERGIVTRRDGSPVPTLRGSAPGTTRYSRLADWMVVRGEVDDLVRRRTNALTSGCDCPASRRLCKQRAWSTSPLRARLPT